MVRAIFILLTATVVCLAQAQTAIREHAENKVAIVFVHGLGGDAEGTWTAKSDAPPPPPYWPRIVMDDEHFAGANIYVASYPSRLWERGLDIEQTAAQLDWTFRPILAAHDKVVFVCHSLGGIVVREYLLQFQVPRDKVPMIYFFGTPSRGVERVAWAKLVSPSAQLRQLAIGERSYLDKLGDRWVNGGYAAVVKSYCVYEKGKFPEVVDPESAKFACNAGIFPIVENHFNIVKPRDRSAQPNRALATAYRDVIHGGVPPPLASARVPTAPVAAPLAAAAPVTTPTQFWDRFIAEYNRERPGPPSGIGASALCDAGKPIIIVSTTAVPNATHYIVHRNGRETFHTREPVYTDTDVVPGMPYSYSIQACDPGGCGPALPYKATDRAMDRCSNQPPVCSAIEAKIARNEGAFSAITTDSDGDPLSIIWNFGDGRQLAASPVLRHTFAKPGRYRVAVSVSDGYGGVAACAREVEVRGKTLTVEEAEEAWIAEEIAQLWSVMVKATPASGPASTRFLFRAEIPEKYGKPVAYRWNFNDNGTPGGEWSARSSSREMSHVFTIYQDVAHERVGLEVTFADGRVVQFGGASVIVRRLPRREPMVSTATRH